MTIVLTTQQETGVHEVHDWYHEAKYRGEPGFFYFGGYAGTGKSTILPTIIESVGLRPEDVAFCAPTGKAAKVMGEKLAAFGINTHPRTIHSLIYRPKGEKLDTLVSQQMSLEGKVARLEKIQDDPFFDPNELKEARESLRITNIALEEALENYDGGPGRLQFTLNAESDIRKAKLVVVDEASMVGAQIARDVLNFNRPVLAIGDPGQLPPVMDTPGFTYGDPDFFLTEIHRQAADNPIIRLSVMARDGEDIPYGDYGDGVRVVRHNDDDVTFNPEFTGKIIVGRNVTRWDITKRIRGLLGINTTGPVSGEPLIVRRNSKNKPLVNGSEVVSITDIGDLVPGSSHFEMKIKDDIGAIHVVECYQGLIEELYRGKNNPSASLKHDRQSRIRNEHIDFGLVITAHISQGSQWDKVALHDESRVFREDAHRWLYTGLTRAAKELTIIK